MITYNEAFNDGYEQALEKMGYDTYAEEGLYDLDSFVPTYESYDDAYEQGYVDALEALNLFKKNEEPANTTESQNMSVWKRLKSAASKLIEAVRKFLTVTLPNFFSNLFKKNPAAKNSSTVKELNKEASDLNSEAKEAAKFFGIAAGKARDFGAKTVEVGKHVGGAAIAKGGKLLGAIKAKMESMKTKMQEKRALKNAREIIPESSLVVHVEPASVEDTDTVGRY